MEWIISCGIFSVIAIIDFVVVQRRRLRYKRMATKLRAQFVPQGLFKTGKIIGEQNGKEFLVETYTISSGRSSSFRTSIHIECTNNGIPLIIQSSFLKNFPDWRYVFTLGDGETRVFVTHIKERNVPVPLEHRAQLHVENILGPLKAYSGVGKPIRRGTVYVASDAVTFTVRGILGILKDAERIKQIFPVLETISSNIEANPVV